MPNFDGTGPLGRGSVAGRRRSFTRTSVNSGRGTGLRHIDNGDSSLQGFGLGGSKDCTCPKCGLSVSHVRGVPCTKKKCPECGAVMRGMFCA